MVSSANQILETPIEFLKGVGPLRASVLKKHAEIFTFNDLLNYFPFRYVDKTKIHKVKEINSDAVFIQLKGYISGLRELGDGKNKRLTANFSDDSATIELVWFKGIKWIQNSIKEGYEYYLFGKPSIFKNYFNIVHPELELSSLREEKSINIRFQPVYSTNESLSKKGLDSKGILKLQIELLGRVSETIDEILPNEMLTNLGMISRKEAYRHIHFPADTEILEKEQYRLKFDELFIQQLEIISFRLQRDVKVKGYKCPEIGSFFNLFYHKILPFQLTEAQKRVIREIRNDMRYGKQMNRLLQGDVGSGKTIVALMCMLIAIDNNMQASLMAPTEILATQHYFTIINLLKSTSIKVALLTGSTKVKERRIILSGIETGEINILIGTHALMADDIKFKQLGLAVIDEQHKFGVAQRAKMWTKSHIPPHVLIMTATPIPRTLAMTFYGDLDTSVIDELPPGRKEIKTYHFYENSRIRLVEFIKTKIAEGRQVYIVYPLIAESEKLDFKNLMEGYDHLSEVFPLPEYQIGIVHGKMKSDVKEYEMKRFKEGISNILISTTVIEVGVDVPNASVMVIESAERFGLSQLHQLRGRVGRGAEQSYCILMTSNKLTQDAKVRMETMVSTTDGFKIAEVDLALRGPGDLSGTQQSGLMDFKIANLATDQKILQLAREHASDLLANDPVLEENNHAALKSFLINFRKGKYNWSLIS